LGNNYLDSTILPVENGNVGFSLEHLGRSLLLSRYGPESIFAMMTCYFDESGGVDLGWIFACGYAASVRQWERFEIDWKILLAKYDVPYFHMTECAHFEKHFAKWKNNQSARSCFLRDAAEIVRQNVRHSFVALVSYEIFAAADLYYKLSEIFKSPYSLAGRACVEAAHEELKTGMECVFADGCPDKEGLIRSMMAYPPYREIPSFKSPYDSKSSDQWPEGRKGVVPLQAADFLAYESRKLLFDRKKLKSEAAQFRKSMLAISKNVSLSLNLITPEVIDRICLDGGIERR
jgi:hypothetical protein